MLVTSLVTQHGWLVVREEAVPPVGRGGLADFPCKGSVSGGVTQGSCPLSSPPPPPRAAVALRAPRHPARPEATSSHGMGCPSAILLGTAGVWGGAEHTHCPPRGRSASRWLVCSVSPPPPRPSPPHGPSGCALEGSASCGLGCPSGLGAGNWPGPRRPAPSCTPRKPRLEAPLWDSSVRLLQDVVLPSLPPWPPAENARKHCRREARRLSSRMQLSQPPKCCAESQGQFPPTHDSLTRGHWVCSGHQTSGQAAWARHPPLHLSFPIGTTRVIPKNPLAPQPQHAGSWSPPELSG